LKEFGRISYINVFIGANNSRKSRFMRELLKQDGFGYSSQRILSFLAEMHLLLNNSINQLHLLSGGASIKIDIGENEENTHQWQNTKDHKIYSDLANSHNKAFRLDNEFFQQFATAISNLLDNPKEDTYNTLTNITKNNVSIFAFLANFNQDKLNIAGVYNIRINHHLGSQGYYTFQGFLKELTDKIQQFLEISFKFESPIKTYIPTLRTAVSLYEEKSGVTKITENVLALTVTRHYALRGYPENQVCL